jgi:hypothetical protein
MALVIRLFAAYPNDNDELFASTLYQAICVFCNAPSPPLPIRKLLLLLWKVLLVRIDVDLDRIAEPISRSLSSLSAVSTVPSRKRIERVNNTISNLSRRIRRRSLPACRPSHHPSQELNASRCKVKQTVEAAVAAPDVLNVRYVRAPAHIIEHPPIE